MKKVKFKAIAYHLHHPLNSRNCEEKNMEISNLALNKKIIRAKNGYDSL